MEKHETELLAALSLMHRNTVETESWITPLRDVLEGIDEDEAAWRPAPGERSLWEIVLHIEAWTSWAVHFLQGRDTTVTDWPPTGTESWAATQQRVESTLAAFGEGIAALRAEALFESPTPEVTPTSRLLGIASILVHNAYHAGQLTKLRDQYTRR